MNPSTVYLTCQPRVVADTVYVPGIEERYNQCRVCALERPVQRDDLRNGRDG